MKACESKTGGVCGRAATWKQSVHAGNREAGQFLFYSHWCDEHAEKIAEKRRTDWTAPATMARITDPIA